MFEPIEVYPKRNKITGTESILETAPSKNAVAIEDFKSFARIKHTNQAGGKDSDRFLEIFLKSGIDEMQRYLGRALITQSRKITMDKFPSYPVDSTDRRVVELPYPKLISVTSIKTYDLDDVPTTMDWSKYQVDSDSEPGLIYFLEGSDTVIRAFRGIEIIYQCGYGTAPEDVPESIRIGIMNLAWRAYNSREPVDVKKLPPSVLSSIDYYRVIRH